MTKSSHRIFDYLFKLSKMLKKLINLTEWLKTYSFKKKHKVASREKYLSTFVQIITFLFCINLSVSIPIFKKTNSINKIIGKIFLKISNIHKFYF